jgi:hypothetical protein
MNVKMHMIQCVSIENLIQMKSIEVIDNGKNTMNPEFQHLDQSQFGMMPKNSEPICVIEHPSKSHRTFQKSHSLLQPQRWSSRHR